MTLIKRIVIWLLTLEARLVLLKYRPFIVAVTGSVGKTSTKDAIYSVLKDQSGHVRKSEKSLNSDIGLPLTILGLPTAWRSMSGWFNNLKKGLGLIVFRHEYPDTLVLELGADHPGDIKSAASWLKPNIVVITLVSKTPVHVEFFSSPEQVFQEKSELAKAVRKGGTLVLFADDEKVMTMADLVKDRNVSVITFGTSAHATVRGGPVTVAYGADLASAYPTLQNPVGISFDLIEDGVTVPISVTGIIGQSYQYPLLAAAAVGKARLVPLQVVTESLNGYNPPKGRMNIIPGANGSTIIDDTYNSSPDAAVSALQTLKNLNTTGAKIAVLGDMMELGKYSADEHRAIGREAAASCTQLITVGQRSRATADEALKSGMKKENIFSFDSSQDVIDQGLPVVVAGDVVLVKGSQSVRMERIVKQLLRHPERAEELLVRQEREWLNKK